MSITGSRSRQIYDALLPAFDEDGLEQLCTYELDIKLGAVTAPSAGSNRVFQLIEWAKRTGRVADLIAGAYNCNPTNKALGALVQEAQAWPEGKAAGLTLFGQRAVVFAPRRQELQYLDAILAQYEALAGRYTPLAGDTEIAVPAAHPTRWHDFDRFLPPEFALLAAEDQPAPRFERKPVHDLRQAMHQYRRLVVLGEPGSGKTTTLRMLHRDYAQAAKADPAAPLPVRVELNRYSGDEPALEFVLRNGEDLSVDLTRHLPAYLHAGRCVLLLDGLNEMPQRDYADRVRRIQLLLDRFPAAPVAVTCRAADYVEALRLQKLEILPLDKKRQREYLHRYLGEAEGDALFWQLAGGKDAAALWHTWQSAGGSWDEFWQADKMPEDVYKETTAAQDALWAKLRSGAQSSLLVLAANPYLLAMLSRLYRPGEGKLPQNRASLFGSFVALLFKRENDRRQTSGAGWPGEATLRAALAQLAFAMQRAGERGTSIERAWAEAQLVAAGCTPSIALRAAEDATLLDLAGGRVRFVHQLLQEYFAALAWQAQLAKGADLRPYWPDGWTIPSGWEETAVLLAGLLPDMTAFIRQLLPVNPPLAARCIAESGGVRPSAETMDAVQASLVEIAVSFTAPIRERVAAGDALNYLGDGRPGVGVKDGMPDILWCSVSASEFLMGNTKETDSMAHDWEMPQHIVYLAEFAISKYPITNAQYQAFVDDFGYTERWRNCWTAAGWQWKEQNSIAGLRRIGSDFDPANHPVVGVSWYEAVAFCGWLTAKLGRSIMLPTEAQWEKAARGVDGRRYPWGPEITPEHANYSETGIGSTSPVGVFTKGESPYHVQDAAGNVWEWTTTKRADSYQKYKPDEDLEGDAWRSLRGGAWSLDVNCARCAYRYDGYPDEPRYNVGFRVVSPNS